MLTAVAGKKIVYLYRVLEEAANVDAAQIAFVTENGRTIKKDSDTTKTKDGNIITDSPAEVEISCTSLLAKGDKLLDKLEDAMINNKIVEIWETNLDEPSESGSNKFKGSYYQGGLNEFEQKANAEDMVEVSLTFKINGTGVSGDVTVTDAQQKAAQYSFADTPKTGA